VSAPATECPSPSYLVNDAEGRYVRVPCKRRRCAWCGPHIWKPFVQAKLFRGINVEGRPLRVFCLTPPGHVEDFAAWNASAPQRWSSFQSELRRHFHGLSIEFWKVAEYQRRGLLHFHGLIAGIRWVDLDWLKDLAQRHGFGPRLEFHAPRGSHRALVGYFTKYLLKGVTDFAPDELANHVMHVTTSSHGWAPDWLPRRRSDALSSWRWVQVAEWWRMYGAAEYLAAHPEHAVQVSSRAPGDKGAVAPGPIYHHVQSATTESRPFTDRGPALRL
jgi:hypothetical protein